MNEPTPFARYETLNEAVLTIDILIDLREKIDDTIEMIQQYIDRL
jgi:hypothetical protein